jgi:hypothetical protein
VVKEIKYASMLAAGLQGMEILNVTAHNLLSI